MNIVMCGDPDWEDYHSVYVIISGSKLVAQSLEEELVIYHRGYRGLDTVVETTARLLGVQTVDVHPDKRHGVQANSKRNQAMIDDYKPQAVYGFKLGLKSTASDDIVRRAREAGVPTYTVTHE